MTEIEVRVSMVCRKIFVLAVFFLLVGQVFSAEEKPDKSAVPTHADAALILAKYSGLFDRYVQKEATLSECVTFLNNTGIYFGLLEVANGKEFTIADCARTMGQIELVLSGEAEYLSGKVKLPKGVDSWVDFCIMNGVHYVEGYQAMVAAVQQFRK